MNAALAAKCKAVNKTHAYIPELYALFAKVFAPLVGQKILKADGEFTKKVAALLPKLPYDDNGIRVYRSKSTYSIGWTINVSENVAGGGVMSYSNTVHVCELEGDTLVKIGNEPKGYRTDYTPEEIEQKRQTVADAERALSNARGALSPFDTYDR